MNTKVLVNILLKLVVITIPFTGQISFAQKKIDIPLYRHGDTIIAYRWAKETSRKIGLQDLTIIPQPLHVRFWITNQVVDIWTTDLHQFEGNLISYTTPYTSEESKKPEKRKPFYHVSKKIDAITAKQIYELARNQMLFDIPVQDSIRGWSLGSDGYSVSIEFATSSHYSFKHYWGPRYQQNLREAQIIDRFYQSLATTLNMSENWLSFINKLPKGCYHTGTLSLNCNERRKRQKTAYN